MKLCYYIWVAPDDEANRPILDSLLSRLGIKARTLEVPGRGYLYCLPRSAASELPRDRNGPYLPWCSEETRWTLSTTCPYEIVKFYQTKG